MAGIRLADLIPSPLRVPLTGGLGVGALFSGIALLGHILFGYSLVVALATTASLLVLAVGLAWRRSHPSQRARLTKLTGVGLLSGVTATAVYDVTRFALSRLDDSPFEPFETIRIFGVLLAGPAAPDVVTYGAGASFHALNGISFGIAFCFLFGRPGVATGIAWGLFLEAFQLTLYPGWLDIRSYREFVQISALSHLAYGAALGLSCKYGLREPRRKG